MNTIQLPVRLRRRLEGSYDPVRIFQELAEVPSVSFSEQFLYEYLWAECDHLREGLTSTQQDKLEVKFTPAGQLLISWRGRNDDNRKTVLVAHVDREGFLVRELDKSTAVCWHTSDQQPEPNVKGSLVRLICPGSTIEGKITAIAPLELSPAQPFNHQVVVQITKRLDNRRSQIFKNDYFRGIGQYKIPSWDYQDKIIASTNVDNTAGVSVLMSLMNAIVRHNWRVNVDCLFTTCEEAGFCGMVAEILSGSNLAAQEDGDVICIVVDSSSHADFCKRERLLDPEPSREEAKKQAVAIALENVVVRTGDCYTVFDPEVSKLLLAAATNLQGASGLSERAPWAAGRRRRARESFVEQLRKTVEKSGFAAAAPAAPESGKINAMLGSMLGGWCEATPLYLEGAIRQRRSGSLPPLGLRVGSIGIPIANYRNSFKKELQPERCHESSLRGASQLLGEAVRLCHRWPFSTRAEAPPDSSSHAAAIVKGLLDWQDRFAGLSSVTNNWIREQSRKRGIAV